MAHISENEPDADFEPLPIYRRPKDDKKADDSNKESPPTLTVKVSESDTDRPFLDIVNELKGNHFDLRSKIDNESDSNSRDRILVILRIYDLWIGRKEQRQQRLYRSNRPLVSMRELLDGELDVSYKWRSFVSDYNAVLRTRGKVSGKRSGLTEWECSGTQCTINGRHQRDRTFYGQNRVEREALYFIEREHGGSADKEEDDDDDVVRELVTQQMLDTLHCLVLHSVSMPSELHQLLQEDADSKTENDEHDLCHDPVLQKVLDLVERERERTRRRRPNADDQKYDKFMTKKEVQTDVVPTTNISDHRCFLDILTDKLERGQVAKPHVEAFYHFLVNDRHDTDSVMDDIAQKDADYTNSNLVRRGRMLSDSASEILVIVRRLCLEKRVRASTYSPGFRYFYWPFYAHNENERNEVWPRAYEGNEGHKLKDWFIVKKYGNLKEEALNNKVAPFSLHQFKVTLCKSQEKLSAWNEDKRARKLVCKVTYWGKLYGIKKGDRITVKHVQSLLFYTNYSKQCYLFGATYRKTSELESNESLKERHSEVAIWGRLLRETVEVFGIKTNRSNIVRFYHGVSEELYFASTSIKLCGPTSTTGDFLVAAGRFARNGLVVEFTGKLGAMRFFDCPFWSDFADEDEKLFIGGLQHFAFATIRNIKTRQNYGVYTKAISIFQYMIVGYPVQSAVGTVHKKHCSAFSRLFEEEIAQKAVKGESSVVPDYVLFLWHNLVVQVKHCELLWYYMTKEEFSIRKVSCFGYKLFAALLCNEDMTAPDFGAFTKLLPNLETVSIYWRANFRTSITLTPWLVSNLLESLQTHSKMKRIDIVNPKGDIMGFVAENKEQFEEIGWTLSKTVFEHFHYGKCEANLCIERV